MDPLELVVKTLHSFGEKQLARDVLEVFGGKAEIFSQYNDIAKISFEVRDLPKAIKYGELALQAATAPQERYITSKNLINVYNQSNHPEKALNFIQKCKEISPEDAELLFEETISYSQLGQHDRAHQQLFDLERRKDLPEDVEKKIHHNLSSYYFMRDDLNMALSRFLTETEKEAYKNIKLSLPKWEGIPQPGRTIVIDANCGAGDEVMHVRFMKNLKELGMYPVWSTTRRELSDVFNHNGFRSVCVWDEPEHPSDACVVYALALPYYLGMGVGDLGREPYLEPLPDKERRFSYIEKDKKIRVGMNWNSDSGFEQAHFRSVGFFDMWNAISSPERSLYSLQMSDNPVPKTCRNHVKEFHFKGREFSDTFSIVNQMDVIVTSCTSIAHISASMGKETCVLVPIMEYYAWTSSTGKSWWYGDNVHLFKQKKPRDWTEPLKELKEFLNDRAV